MAYGLPVEGADGPFLGALLSPVPTCDVTATVGDARRALEARGEEVVVVLAAGGLAVGEVDAETLGAHGDEGPVLDVMDPVPTTVRPSVTVASVAEAGGGRRLVTTSDGRLLGAATIDSHAEHDHEHGGVDVEQFERELTGVMQAVEERFGEGEPGAEELRAFLHDRLVAEGRSPEEADRFLDELPE